MNLFFLVGFFSYFSSVLYSSLVFSLLHFLSYFLAGIYVIGFFVYVFFLCETLFYVVYSFFLVLSFFVGCIFSLGFLGQKKNRFTTILDRKCLTTLQEAFMWFLTSDSKKEKKRGEYFKKLKRQDFPWPRSQQALKISLFSNRA